MAEALIPVFIPSLTELLFHAEKQKGSPLTEAEVVQIRDNAVCIAMAPERATAMAQRRGFDDIDPRHCWEDWQQVRANLKPTEPGHGSSTGNS